MANKFGDRIKNLRIKANLTQAELAEKLGYTPQTISYWEAGSREPDLDSLSNLSALFGVSLDYLIFGKQEQTIGLDDMDDKKRLSYVIRHDDLANFKKYKYCERFFSSDMVSYPSVYYLKQRKPNIECWKEVLDAKAKKVFVALCQYMNKLNDRKQMAGGWVYPFIDEFVKMAIDCDYPEALETIGFRFFAVSGSDEKSKRTIWTISAGYPVPWPEHNDARSDVTVKGRTVQIEFDTLEYIFSHRKDAPKCFEYATTLQTTVPNPQFSKESLYAITFLEDDIVRLSVKYQCFDVLNKILGVYKEEDENAKQVLSRSDGRFYDCIYGTYIYWREFIRARLFRFPLDAINNLIKIGQTECAKRLNDFNKTPLAYVTYDGRGRASNRLYQRDCEFLSDNAFDRAVRFNSPLSGKDRVCLTCIDEHILVASEIEKLRDLKLVREILAAGYYNYYEFAHDMLSKGKPGELFKFLLNHGEESIARFLILGESNYPMVLGRIYERFETIGKRKQRKDVNREGMDSVIAKQNELCLNNGEEWRIAKDGKVIHYRTEAIKLGPNSLIDLIQSKKEVIYENVVKAMEKEKEAAEQAKKREKAIDGLNRGYFEELLSKKGFFAKRSERLFVIDLCSFLDAIFKYDYHCEGIDFRERMDNYFQKLKNQSPKDPLPSQCFEKLPVGEQFPDEDTSNDMLIANAEGVLNRLRMERNSFVHSESSKFEPLSKDELGQCLDYAFAIAKE